MNSVWDYAPEWANWRVRAADGKWFWFENRPAIVSNYYTSPTWFDVKSGKMKFAEFGVQEEGWALSLEQRPALKLNQENTEGEVISFAEYAKKLGCEFLVEKRTDCSSNWKNIMDNAVVGSIINEEEGNTVETVNHPAHYNQVPGIECIDVVRHFSFNRGNAIKYVWRAGYKGNEIEDLEKAIWYLQDEIEKLKEERQRFIQESMDKSFEEHKDVWQELADK